MTNLRKNAHRVLCYLPEHGDESTAGKQTMLAEKKELNYCIRAY